MPKGVEKCTKSATRMYGKNFGQKCARKRNRVKKGPFLGVFFFAFFIFSRFFTKQSHLGQQAAL